MKVFFEGGEIVRVERQLDLEFYKDIKTRLPLNVDSSGNHHVDPHINHLNIVTLRVSSCILDLNDKQKRLRKITKKYHKDTSYGDLVESVAKEFIKSANNYYPNVPDLGPQDVNVRVSDNLHLNIDDDGSASPLSQKILDYNNILHTCGIAVTKDNKNIISTKGALVNKEKVKQNIITIPRNITKKSTKPYLGGL